MERAGVFAARRVRGASVVLTGRFRTARFLFAPAFRFLAAGDLDAIELLFPDFALVRDLVFDVADGLGDLRDFISGL